MHHLPKFALYPFLMAAACIVAGIYGALHDQVSYTVSPDYFFFLKFDQFAIADDLRNRIGASIVGWYASWWMGLLISVPVLSVGLLLPDWKAYVRHCLLAFVVVALTALVVGLSGLAYGCLSISQTSLPGFRYPEGVTDRAAFARVGVMHRFSYLGGEVGIITGSIYLIVVRWRLGKPRPWRPRHDSTLSNG